MVAVLDSGFASLSAVTEIQLPDTVTSLRSWAVYDMAALERIMVSDNIASVGSSYLRGCPELVSATPMMPSKLTSLNLQNGYVSAGVPKLMVDTMTVGDGERDVTFSNPTAGSFGSGLYTNVVFNEGITTLPKIFRVSTVPPINVTIPSTVTEIKTYFYSYCGNTTGPGYSVAKTIRLNCSSFPTFGSSSFSGFKAKTINFIVKYDAFNTYLEGKYTAYDEATHKTDFEAVFGPDTPKPTGLLNASGTFCGNQWITVVREVSEKTKITMTGSPLELGGDGVVPGYGTTECDGAVVSVPLAAPQYAVDEDYLYQCNGYTTEFELEEDVWSAPVTNLSLTGTLVTTKKEYARITWLWEKVGAKLKANANDDLGAVTASLAPVYDGCYLFDTEVTLTATKTGANDFAGWYLPSLPNGKSDNATIVVTVTAPTAAFAYFPTTWHHVKEGANDYLRGNGWDVRIEAAATTGTYKLRIHQSYHPCAHAITPGAAVLDFKNLAIDDGSVIVEAPDSTITGSSYDFSTRDALRDVYLPNTVTNIGNYFCYNLKALRELEYPQGINFGVDCSFRESPLLDEVTLSGNLADTIGDRTLYSLPALKKLTMPKVPSTIHKNGFSLGTAALQVRIIIPSDNSGGWQALLDDNERTRDLTREERREFRQKFPDAKMALKILRKNGLDGVAKPNNEQYLCHGGANGTMMMLVY